MVGSEVLKEEVMHIFSKWIERKDGRTIVCEHINRVS